MGWNIFITPKKNYQYMLYYKRQQNAGCFAERSLTLEYCRKKSWCPGLFLIAFIAIAFFACATKEPVLEQTDEPIIHIEMTYIPIEMISKPIEMISIPGGSFRMGSPRGSGYMNERPDHQVTLPTFLLGKYEVTQGQYFEITGAQPSSCWTNPENPEQDGWTTLPVETVNWYEALIFCNKLSVKEDLNPVYRVNGSVNPDDWGDVPTVEADTPWDVAWISDANGYRLPTEAEWEYAARGGIYSKNYRYAGSNNPDHVLWYYENSKIMSHEVGAKAPNELDLYDMSGNVMEWCWDWQGAYTANAKENPTGPSSGLDKVVRGGGWSYALAYALVVYRHYNQPHYRGVNLGFRVARSL